MPEIEELHKEFEDLISELEKLKNLNLLTQENANYLKNIIKKSSQLFDKLDEELTDLYSTTEKINISLSDSVTEYKAVLEELEGIVKNIQEVINSSINSASNKMINSIEVKLGAVESNSRLLQDQLRKSMKEVENKIEKQALNNMNEMKQLMETLTVSVSQTQKNNRFLMVFILTLLIVQLILQLT